ncbi:MAG: hypothetical protein ABJ308_04635 [Halieaceae bacterium]
MKRVIGELRKRGVFRAAGLYIAGMWLLLQIADVVFPAFDIPDSALRYILFGALAGFPLAMAFSWFYEVSSEGIRSEEEISESHGARASDYLSSGTIILLVLALGISLYANYEQASDRAEEVTQELISILVSDFVNETGDPIFDGSLEPALAIGMEGAPFISSFPRHHASATAAKISGSEALNEESARLVSVREGIRLILLGSIAPSGDGYEFSLRAVDARDGEVVADAEASADSKLEVLPAIGQLAVQIREDLGDASLQDDPEANETFTAASLEAARYYTIAQTYMRREQNQQAAEFYEKAIIEDTDFGRAYSGWAIVARRLGRTEESQQLWEKTLALLDTMTERERYRTLGVYYLTVTGNYLKAIENYEILLEKYPADDVGRNNMAVAYFYSRQFEEALTQGAELLLAYPEIPAHMANYALYAMYSGHFDTALSEASKLLEIEPGYLLAYIPQAVAELARGDKAAATAVYQRLAQQSVQAASLANTGLVDIALLSGDWAGAESLLREGIARDIESGNQAAASRKNVYLTLALLEQEQEASARLAMDAALVDADGISQLLPAARLLVRLKEVERAELIRQQLDSELQAESRAAADIIAAEILLSQDQTAAAVDALTNSIAHSDAWLARFDLGRTYASAGYYAEALGELEKCAERIGESSALFLDDTPTFHYSAELFYWLGVTRQELGMQEAAREDLSHYLSLRVDSDHSIITRDARQRLGAAGA